MASCMFDFMADDLLLYIVKFLPVEDLLVLSKINSRLQRVCYDRTIVRRSSFEGCYSIKEEDVREYTESCHAHVQVLNFNHCHWLPQRCLQWTVSKCKHLSGLHMIECKVKVENLVLLVAMCSSLKDLSFSISSFSDIKRDVFTTAHETTRSLRKLWLYYTSRELALTSYLGEHPTILDLCENLEELHIGSAGMAIPELYRPIITKPNQHLNLRTMTMTNNIHAGAQMLFYGTLSQLPNSRLNWHTLLMPNVNFEEFVKKPEFRECLQNVGTIKHLDVSGSKVKFPHEAMDMTLAMELRHLNVGSTKINSEQLREVASNCNYLTSLNLCGCGAVFQGRDGLDLCGLESVFDHCRHLQHLNLGGEHHHLLTLPGEEEGISRVFSKMKGLRSLCLPVCFLCETDYEHPSRSGKRQQPGSRSPGTHSKRRCLDNGQSSPHECSHSDQDSSLSSSAGAHGVGSRTSLLSQSQGTSTFLLQSFRNNADLRELELIAVNFVSAIHKNKFVNPKQQQFGPCSETRRVKDDRLESIAQFTELRSLTLMGAPGLVSGQCLVAIAQGCHKLKQLRIGYLGGAMYGNLLAQALVHLQGLEDLRIEQPHLYLNSVLFEGLSQCKCLRRLCIIAKHSTFHMNDLARMVDQLPRLTVIQLFAGGTITACKNLTTLLQKRYVKTRPALSVSIYPLLYDGIVEVTKSIPAKHYDELTRFQSRVCLLPAEWIK